MQHRIRRTFEDRERVYARTASSTAAKIDLLKCVFDICEIDASELSFEMPLDASEE